MEGHSRRTEQTEDRISECEDEMAIKGKTKGPFRYRKPPEYLSDLTKIELPHGILSLKQQEQRLEKEY
jgi:hypothetical protein